MDLQDLGWNEFHKNNYDAVKTGDTFPARVAIAQREKYRLYGEAGPVTADIRGKLRFEASSASDLPVVGDWVTAKMRPEGGAADITAILPRFSKFSRKEAGETSGEQVLVANIDTVFLVSGLDGDFNVRRLERYLALAFESGAKPVIVLNKTDKCADVAECVRQAEAAGPGIPVIALSAIGSAEISGLEQYVPRGNTVAFLGSSGAGKSTIINRLLGEERQKVGAVRASDSRGRHVTTSRELIALPGGGLVIDNPGMRELQLWLDGDALDGTFADVKELASKCKFGDCTHAGEPGCAVKAAIEQGVLDQKRFDSYLKLKKEERYLATRREAKDRNEKIIWEKNISKLVKQVYNHRKKNRF
jgi:ribosome biogenesis GTPase